MCVTHLNNNFRSGGHHNWTDGSGSGSRAGFGWIGPESVRPGSRRRWQC